MGCGLGTSVYGIPTSAGFNCTMLCIALASSSFQSSTLLGVIPQLHDAAGVDVEGTGGGVRLASLPARVSCLVSCLAPCIWRIESHVSCPCLLSMSRISCLLSRVSCLVYLLSCASRLFFVSHISRLGSGVSCLLSNAPYLVPGVPCLLYLVFRILCLASPV